MTKRAVSPSALEFDLEAHDALLKAQRMFGDTSANDVYELRLTLASPAITTAEKSNSPPIGLPTLDGFLSYVAFHVALTTALQTQPELSQRLIWQWNVALRNPQAWIEFSLPLREVVLPNNRFLFDCSVGIPLDDKDQPLIPAGGYAIQDGENFVTYPAVVDSLPLRRRVVEPYGRPISLKTALNTSDGKNKLLDNRLYFPLITRYLFLFRGDVAGVEEFLKHAIEKNIGLGKKTSLGFGQISSFAIQKSGSPVTFAYPIRQNLGDGTEMALIKSLPFDYAMRQRELADRLLFGCEQFAVVGAIETHGAYRPPYWLRQERTQILRYGSVIQRR
jgi:hypothetical protein